MDTEAQNQSNKKTQMIELKEKKTLSKDWRWTKLGDVCQTTSGGTPQRGVKEYYNGNIPWVKSGELNDGLITSVEESITELGIKNSSAKIFPAGTLLIALYGATVGRLGILNVDAATNQAVCAIYTGDNIDKNFLFFYLLSKRNDLLKISFGGAQPNISQEIVRSILIPLPPLDEQKRIAARLEDKMSHIEQARQAVEESLSAAWWLSEAYSKDVFKSHKWKSANLGSLCTIVRGSSPRPKGDPRYYGKDVPRLMVEDVTRDGMYVTPKVDFLTHEGALLSRPMKKGDVVMVVSGAPGLPGILNVDACIHDGFVGFRGLQTEKVLPEFLYFALIYYRFENDKEATGAIFRNLTTDQVSKFMIPIPPIETQKEIVLELTKKLRETESLINHLESQLAEINELPSALLRQAFAGQL